MSAIYLGSFNFGIGNSYRNFTASSVRQHKLFYTVFQKKHPLILLAIS